MRHALGFGFFREDGREAIDGELRCRKSQTCFWVKEVLWLGHGHRVGIEGKMVRGSFFFFSRGFLKIFARDDGGLGVSVENRMLSRDTWA